MGLRHEGMGFVMGALQRRSAGEQPWGCSLGMTVHVPMCSLSLSILTLGATMTTGIVCGG